MFKWKDTYSCNIAEIDIQHKNLFKIGEKIFEIVSLNDGYDHYDEIMNTINELKEYTLYHFNYEEKLMEKHNYANLEGQKLEHKKFIDQLIKLENEDIDNAQRSVSMNILLFVADWIEKHILKSDMGYKEYLNSKGVY